ncbi:MAG TPA: SpoIIE family protein phosphatase [Candidatus Limnocylindrales bacterium]|jgi:anti-sigma regulatory factor (Ser/Thr protein kinase)|nr:SpoIIE family protein phosphatase [Candidatus Limnocylindrales bacterium]
MSVVVRVEEQSGVGDARRRSVALARDAGLGDQDQATLALVVTELATNLVKHTPAGGEMLFRAIGPARAVEVLAVDRGPGIEAIADALRDRYSTTGTSGTGLGAVKRLAAQFEVQSTPKAGSVVLARVGGLTPQPDGIASGGVCVPKRGETVSGDAWTETVTGAVRRVIVADGVGHGPDAARAAGEALRVFRARPETPLPELMRHLHDALRPTRGAAIAIAELDAEAQRLRFIGVGNIVAAVSAPPSASGATQRNLVSHPGTVGHEIRRVQEFVDDWPRGATLVLHSDGARARWSLASYPGIANRDPAVIAGVLYRDFSRGTDDVTVVALRGTR